MSNDLNFIKTGPGIVPMLTVLFIGLKLTNFIEWSWWWVLSPLWIAFSILFIVFLLILVSLNKFKKTRCNNKK